MKYLLTILLLIIIIPIYNVFYFIWDPIEMINEKKKVYKFWDGVWKDVLTDVDFWFKP